MLRAVIAAAVAAAAAAVPMQARVTAPSAPIAIDAGTFTLRIDPASCTAQLAVAASAAPQSRRVSGQDAVLGDAVPFVQLYNRVSDARPQNLETCAGVSEVSRSDTEAGSTGLLDVQAANGYGKVRIGFEVVRAGGAGGPGRVYFRINDTSAWHGDAVEKHVAFGMLWQGALDPAEAPVIQGKLQGAVALPQTESASAGYVTVTGDAYYRYVLYAKAGDEVAFGWVPPPGRPAALWQAVAADRGLPPPSPNRALTWLWSGDFDEATADAYADIGNALGIDVLMASGWDTDYLTVSDKAFPSGVAKTVAMLRERGLHLGLHMHPDIVWPCNDTETLECLTTGVGVSPVVRDCPDCVVPEGLAPTYRSGDRFALGERPSEDLGFWFGHDKSGDTAFGGNPKPCGQGSCNSHDWNVTWCPNMTLTLCGWSMVGQYRDGGAVLFGGNATSFGTVPGWPVFDSARTGLTVGMVAHPLTAGATTGAPTATAATAAATAMTRTLMEREGSWSLGLGSDDRLVFAVTLEGSLGGASKAVCTGKTQLTPGPQASYVVRASFNGTGGAIHLFVDGKLDVECRAGDGATAEALVAGRALAAAEPGAPITVGRGFGGALEEMYVKNVSTEHRVGYIYADDNRVLGTYLLDLSRPAGRAYFARAVSGAIDEAMPAAVQYDGFEKLQLIAGQDFGHSSRTWTSGMYRGDPTPDWYHFEGWPLRWGLGVLQGMTAAWEATTHKAAVEASFMAPGLGPWRPDMAPYVDERGDLVGLGLEWHPKLLLRTELTGTAVNAYNTQLGRFKSTYDVDYWLGGLVTGGVPPQPLIGAASEWKSVSRFAQRIRRWVHRYHAYGHATEDAVTTLVYDKQCCHVQGTCEWVACRDAVQVLLSGGNASSPVSRVGLYVGTNATVDMPPVAPPPRGGWELLLFQAQGVGAASVSVGKQPEGDDDLVVRVTSPVSPTSIRLSGGWWVLDNENVRETVAAENGTVLSTRTVFPAPVSGQQAYAFTRDVGDGGWEPSCTIALRKVKQHAGAAIGNRQY